MVGALFFRKTLVPSGHGVTVTHMEADLASVPSALTAMHVTSYIPGYAQLSSYTEPVSPSWSIPFTYHMSLAPSVATAVMAAVIVSPCFASSAPSRVTLTSGMTMEKETGLAGAPLPAPAMSVLLTLEACAS